MNNWLWVCLVPRANLFRCGRMLILNFIYKLMLRLIGRVSMIFSKLCSPLCVNLLQLLLNSPLLSLLLLLNLGILSILCSLLFLYLPLQLFLHCLPFFLFLLLHNHLLISSWEYTPTVLKFLIKSPMNRFPSRDIWTWLSISSYNCPHISCHRSHLPQRARSRLRFFGWLSMNFL